ncbi:hypothetical protein [Devosia sp. A16]|uniref:hypothetical protein n=1 Tax=Devosia sp. A16 TaxID=1736675 RepID=UPI0006D79723|nr:hypothetical protein [Devosia sp. A16]
MTIRTLVSHIQAHLSNYLASQTAAMEVFGRRVSAVEDASGAVATRVTTIETRISLGQQQQDDFQRRTDGTLDELRKQNLAILQAIARLEAQGGR